MKVPKRRPLSLMPAFTLFLFSGAAIAQQGTAGANPAVGPGSPRKLIACRYPVFHVDAASVVGDGSQARPFQRINEAVAAGNARDICAIEIRLAGGRYAESVQISRATTIIGAPGNLADIRGRIDNLTGQSLTIRGLAISDFVKHGLVQKGGTLKLEHVSLRNGAPAVDGTPEDGTALMVSGGAQVKVDDVQIVGNSGQGLHVEGAGTRLWASGLSVFGNRVNPVVIERLGQGQYRYASGVEVAGGASAYFDSTAIGRNQVVGLLIHEASSVNLRNSGVIDTQAVSTPTGPAFGYNVLVRSRSTAQFEAFMSDHANVGIGIQESYVTALTGVIKNNIIGIASFDPAPESSYSQVSCIYPEVKFIGNQSKLSNSTIPLPCAGRADCHRQCRLVPWIPAPM